VTRDDIIDECRSYSPAGLMMYYDWVQKAAGFTLPDHLYPVALAWSDHRIRNLMLIIGPGSGKSLALSQIFPTHEIGHDPTHNFICVAGAENLAQGFQDVVGNIIDRNEAFETLFPGVRPDKNHGWSTEKGLFVTGHLGTVPDASFWAAGISSTALTGKHGSILLFDDLHDDKNSNTPEQCAQVVRKYVTQLVGRGDPMRKGGARKILAGRRWHDNDLYGELKDNGDWVVLTLPFEREGQSILWYDITVPDGMECVFTDGMCADPDGNLTMAVPEMPSPDRWTRRLEEKTSRGGQVVRLSHIQWPYGVDPKEQGFFWPQSDAKRIEYFSAKRLLPEDTEVTYQCNPNARSARVFMESDFDRRYLAPEDLELGVQSPAVAAMCRDGAMVVQSWDTAFSAETSSDLTVCATLLLIPCAAYHKDEDETRFGPCEQHFDIRVLHVWKDKLDFAGIEGAMKSQFMLWQPAWVIVEKRAYGVTAIENLSGILPIVAVEPSSLESKRARAVNGVGAGSVQGWCRQRRVELPDNAPWLKAFLDEMLAFTGVKGGRDDQVDAFVHGVRWAIQNGAGVVMPLGYETMDRVDAAMGIAMNAPHLDGLGIGHNGGPAFSRDDILDPFGECCGHCANHVGTMRDRRLPGAAKQADQPRDWCVLHRRRVGAIFSCDDFTDPLDLNLFG
jgi:phage terminase large subunit-like protein